MTLLCSAPEQGLIVAHGWWNLRACLAALYGGETAAWFHATDWRNALLEQERNKAVVRRLVDEVLNGGRLEVVDELFAPEVAPEVKAWIAPFQASFPDMRMEIVDLIAEGEKVVGRFACSGTHRGEWLGHPPTGRHFERIDEVSIFRFEDGKIVEIWGVEDTLGRMEQLGLR